MVHNVLKVTLVLAILASVYHYVYAHFFMGNSPVELLIGIGILVIGTAMFMMQRQDGMTKGILLLSLIVLVVHYIYAHILMGNNPMDLLAAILLLGFSVVVIFAKKIDFKR